MRCSNDIEYNGGPHTWFEGCRLEQGHEGPCDSRPQPVKVVADKPIWKTDESGYYHSANTKGFLVAVNEYPTTNASLFEVALRKSNPSYNFFFTAESPSLTLAKRRAEEVVSAFTKMLEILENHQ